ncbi:MAG TPA: SDR family oxidoreductase [Euzebyales bacterium]
MIDVRASHEPGQSSAAPVPARPPAQDATRARYRRARTPRQRTPRWQDRHRHGRRQRDRTLGRRVVRREGADVTVVYLEEHDDAKDTARLVEDEGGRCLLVAGDVGDEAFCADVVQQTVDEFGQLDVLVNNAAEQHVSDDIADISTEQLERTFRTNVFAMFHLVKAAAPHLGEGASIINSTSVTAYQGNPMLVDYSATKGAIVAFTRALSQQVIGRGIRVNAVAPGPI